MSASFFSSLINAVGFVGLVSVGLLPLRSWQVLRDFFRDGISSLRRKFLLVIALFIVVFSIWSNVQITLRIFRCLTGTYCGPGVASGWAYLAMLGAVYLAFEAVMCILRKIAR